MEEVNLVGLWEPAVPGFEDRNNDLRRIIRWSEYAEMFYRTNNLQHYKDGLVILEEFLPFATQHMGGSIRPDLARALMLVHDDVEIRTSDVSGAVKSTWPEEQVRMWKEFERTSMKMLVSEFGDRKIMGHKYKDLVEMMFELEEIETQFVKLVDKYVGFNEALHELYGQNPLFAKKGGRDKEAAIRRYERMFTQLERQYPRLEDLLKQDHPIIQPATRIPSLEQAWYKGRPHTEASVQRKTGHRGYDFWRETILKDPDGMDRLITQKLGIRPIHRQLIANILGPFYCNGHMT